jgi:PAS domain-containing protein
VTKKKIEEERLRLLETVATHSKDAILITGTKPIGNIDLPILYANQAYTDITGFTQEDLQNQSPRISQGPLSDKKELETPASIFPKWDFPRSSSCLANKAPIHCLIQND